MATPSDSADLDVGRPAIACVSTALGDYRCRPAAAERASARRHSALYAEADVGHEARRLQVTDSACPSGLRAGARFAVHPRGTSAVPGYSHRHIQPVRFEPDSREMPEPVSGISRTARGTDARRNTTSPRTRHTAYPSPRHRPQHRRTPGPSRRRNRDHTRSSGPAATSDRGRPAAERGYA